MYSDELDNLLFLRKQIDAMWTKTQTWFKRLFCLHILYTILLIIPIYYPYPKFRIIFNSICLGISSFFGVLELISFVNNSGDHFQDMYNVVDAIQLLIQISYTVLVIVYKDVELPFLQNNMGTFKDYGIEEKGL